MNKKVIFAVALSAATVLIIGPLRGWSVAYSVAQAVSAFVFFIIVIWALQKIGRFLAKKSINYTNSVLDKSIRNNQTDDS